MIGKNILENFSTPTKRNKDCLSAFYLTQMENFRLENQKNNFQNTIFSHSIPKNKSYFCCAFGSVLSVGKTDEKGIPCKSETIPVAVSSETPRTFFATVSNKK
jgi:hypothetical protein